MGKKCAYVNRNQVGLGGTLYKDKTICVVPTTPPFSVTSDGWILSFLRSFLILSLETRN